MNQQPDRLDILIEQVSRLSEGGPESRLNLQPLHR